MSRGIAMVSVIGMLAAASGAATPTQPVIFVHGINADEGTWAAIAGTLESSGWEFGGCPSYDTIFASVYSACSGGLEAGHYYRLRFSTNQGLTLAEQGAELSAVIDAVLQLNGATSVIVVAHSMGGLAARSYMQLIDAQKVSRLITVGTPNLGSRWADLCDSVQWGLYCALSGINPLSVAVDQIAPGSAALEELNDLASHPLPTTTTFISIVGKGRAVVSEGFQDGDGVVTVASQSLASVPLFLSPYFEFPIHIESCGGFSIVQTHGCETRDPLVWEKVMYFTDTAIFAGDFEDGHPIEWTVSGETSVQPGVEASDVWITSVFDYDDDYGVNDHRLVVGGWGDSYHSLMSIDLSELPATAVTAELHMYVRHNPGQSTFVPMQLRRVTSAWDENTGWPNRPASLLVRTLPSPVVEGWYFIDVTDLYNGWQAGSFPNLGIELRPTATNNRFNVFLSSDYPVEPSKRPKLVVVPPN